MLPGHGSAFQQLPHQRWVRLSPPYNAPQPQLCQRHRKCQNTRVVKNHSCVSCPLRPPSTRKACGMNKHNPRPPHTTENWHKNAKMLPASSECALALPGDVGNDWAHNCTRFQRRPPPGSPVGLPGEFKDCRRRGTNGYTGTVHAFCVRSASNHFICIVYSLGT